jgi:hypothetical protein
MFSKTSENRAKLMRAITKACDEHGYPNTYSFGELRAHYGAPPPPVAGKIARSRVHEAIEVGESGRLVVNNYPTAADWKEGC